jgi:alkyl hydroperoxide reductase subunit F
MPNIQIYSKDWCPYCAKAKSLLESKDVPYDVVDITNDENAEAEMVERSSRRSVPQIFIDGESIGGYDDLALLNSTGELDERLGRTPDMKPKKVYDVAILGAGPAGMSAAIYAARKNLDTVIISGDVGGQLGTTAEVANYPGFQLISGPELVEQFSSHVDLHGIERMLGERITGIGFRDRCKMINLASGKMVPAKSVIIATGAHKRKLGIPGEEQLAGRGVVYCSTCDGPLFRNKRIAIVGGGNSGLEAAIEMAGMATEVFLVSTRDWSGDDVLCDRVRAAKNVEALRFHRPLEIHGTDKVEALTVQDTISGEHRRIELDAVFIEIGLYPNSEFAIDLVETNPRGEIKVDAHGRTGVQGVFAAGDVTASHDKQVVIACGEGAKAALGAFEYLITQV